MTEIVGVGACVMDTLITLPEFPAEDTKARALEVRQCGGGPVATGLVAAAKLGASAAYIGVLSDDAGGRFLLEDFIKYGVDISHVEVIPGYRSFTSYIWLSRSRSTRTCAYDKGSLPPLTLSEANKEAIRRAKVLMVDGNELEAAIEAATIAKQNGTIVLYDAGGLYPGVERLLALTDILIPSEEFALAHTGKADACGAAEELAARYSPSVLVITQGRQGGQLYEKGKFKRYPAYHAEVVDSNGAGDVFHGAFAAAVIREFSYEQACHFASAVAALKCTGIGARESVPDYNTTIDFLRRNGYEL